MAISYMFITLLLVLVISSYKLVLLQRERAQVKQRLQVVSTVKTQQQSELSALFSWSEKTGPIRQKWQLLQLRIDALFSAKMKTTLLLAELIMAVGLAFTLSFFTPLIRMLIIVLAIVVSVIAVYWFLRVRQHSAFKTAFTQVLGQISRAVSAGISVPQAIAQVAEYQQGILGHEFALIRDKLEIGIQALQEANVRLPYVSFHFFTVALILNEENGGQLREVLHGLSRTLHENAAIKMKIKSLTAEPRMTAIILACLPVLLISAMFFKNPSSFVVLTNSADGQYVLAYVISSMALGLGIIHVLTKVRF